MRRMPFIALGMAAVLFMTAMLAPLPPASARANTASVQTGTAPDVQAGGVSKFFKTLTSLGGKLHSSLKNKRWKNECETWMAATGEQLDVMEEKIDGLTDSIKEVRHTLGDIQTQIDNVSSEIDAMRQEIDQNIAQNTLAARLQSINELAADVQSLSGDLDKIGDENITPAERAQRVANFISRVENDNIEGQFNTALSLLTTPDTTGKSIAEASLDYMKVGHPFYFEIYNDQVACYQNYSDILLSAGYILVEYYHYYSGPYNPRSPFVTINQADLIEKMDTGLDALYSQLDINEDDEPSTLTLLDYSYHYGKNYKFIVSGIFENANLVRLRSTVDEKYYMITVGGSLGTPHWKTIFNLEQTPYGPTDAYMAASSVSDGARSYHPAQDRNEVNQLLRYYSDYSMTVSTWSGTIYDFLENEHPILNPNAYDVDKSGTAHDPLPGNLFIPIALWQIDGTGQVYIDTYENTPDKKLSYDDAKKGVSIINPKYDYSKVFSDEVFSYVFIEDQEGV